MSKRDESGIKLSDIKCYNPQYHYNHGTDWTTSEIEYITTSCDSLVTMSLTLGRTAATISQKKLEFKKAKDNWRGNENS